jgi:cysteinyl-tRNA synthetase
VSLHVYDTATRKLREFVPVRAGAASIYVCGPTPQGPPHIGHVRGALNYDVLRRWLLAGGDKVTLVRNVTDIDDKILTKAGGHGEPWWQWAAKHERAFDAAYEALGCLPASISPRATGHVTQMVELMRRLIDGGHAYAASGDVYFSVASYPAYGELSGQRPDEVQQGEAPAHGKRDPRDFTLWKGAKPGEPSWPTPWGPGRPGWHLECSAMALRLLGEPPIDVHTGGIDLVFPHHENEIAQSEAATHTPFARFWVHVEHLVLDDQKMSKSLGNVCTVQDVLNRGVRASALRYLLLSIHYRKQLKFSWDNLAQAEEALGRLSDCLARLDLVSSFDSHPSIVQRVESAKTEFANWMASDLNTAGALGTMFDLVRALNAAIDEGQVGRPDVPVILEAFAQFDRVLGVLSLRRAEEAQTSIAVGDIDRRIAERQAARRRRDFAAADRIRKDLEDQGILLEDSAAGTRWKRK